MFARRCRSLVRRPSSSAKISGRGVPAELFSPSREFTPSAARSTSVILATSRLHTRSFSSRIRSLTSQSTNGFFNPPNYNGTVTSPSVPHHRLRSPSLRPARRPAAPRSAFADERPNLSPNQKLVPVTAIHMAQTIDLKPLLSSVFESYSTKTQQLGRTSIIVRLSSSSSDEDDALQYVAIYRFGSMVFFNVEPAEIDRLVRNVKKQCSAATTTAGEPAMTERHERFDVFVVPEFATAPAAEGMEHHHNQQQQQQQSSNINNANNKSGSSSRNNKTALAEMVTGDYCIVPQLDMNGVAVISNIMAQTVALDSYNDRVDELLTKFANINSTVTQTGSFSATDKSFLFKTVAQNNGIFIDMISKIRIKDRSDTAWNLTKYEAIHYGLKEEFEIDDRFEHIEFKLNLIQQNAKFFLQVLQHQKSNNLEWIIVVLILAECVLMCVEMSGLGEPLFQGLVAGLGCLIPSATTTPSPKRRRTLARVEDVVKQDEKTSSANSNQEY